MSSLKRTKPRKSQLSKYDTMILKGRNNAETREAVAREKQLTDDFARAASRKARGL